MNGRLFFELVFIVFFLSWLAELAVMKSAYGLKLFDKLDARKIHHGQIPRLGGVVFCPLAILSVLLISCWGVDVSELIPLLIPVLLIVLVGLADDLVGVRYRNKFIYQALAALSLCAYGLCYNNLGGILAIYQMPLWCGWLMVVFMTIFVTNAFNFIDGIDGLSSIMGIGIFSFYAYTLHVMGDDLFAMMAALMPVILLPFVGYNLFGNAETKSKIFMGDAGSLFLGMLFTVLSIRLTQQHLTFVDVHRSKFLFSLAPLLLPLFDVVHVVFYRLYKGANPFAADKSHIHHRFLAMGFSQHTTLLLVVLLWFVFTIAGAFLAIHMNANLAIVVMVVVWAFFDFFVFKANINNKKI